MHGKSVRKKSDTDSENASYQYEETMEKLRSTMDQQNRTANREHDKSKRLDKFNVETKKVFSLPRIASNPIGIVVRKEQHYAVIWSLHDGLMYAPQADLMLGTWVRYRCISGDPIENGKINQLAYSTEDAVPLRITTKLELTVQMAATISLDEDGNESSEYVCVHDNMIGTILCSRDGYVLKRLGRGEELETFVVYAEDHRHISHWIVILVNRGVDDWRKIGNLPIYLDELAEVALKLHKRTDDADDYVSQQIRRPVHEYEEHQTVHRVEGSQVQGFEDKGLKQFSQPLNWRGVIHLTDRKISEVPALVVEHEEEGLISVLHTAFGLARMQGSHPVGTWMMITMLEDQEEDEGEPQATLADNYKLSYYVQRHVKIPPPMSTRVIRTEGGEKLLLCCVVTCGQRCLENPFIGVVDDVKKRVMPENRVPPSSKGYLVEIGLLRSTKKPKNPLFWRVLKSHGEVVGNINNIALENSCVPNEDNDVFEEPAFPKVDPPSPVKSVAESRESCKEEVTTPNVRDKPLYVSSDTESKASDQESIDSPKLKLDDIKSSLYSLAPDAQTNSVHAARQELLCYIPDSMEKEVRGLGIVVRKVDVFAYVYSKTFGLSLLRARDFESGGDAFQFGVGQWIGASFVAATRTDGGEKRRFKSICLPKVVPKQAVLPTRVINNFVHIEVPFAFDEKKVSRCNEEPTRLKVESCLGYAIISETTYKKLELHGTQQHFWVCYIKEKYGCNWKILTSNEISSSDEDDRSTVEENNQISGSDENLMKPERALESPQLLLDFGPNISNNRSPLASPIACVPKFSLPNYPISGSCTTMSGNREHELDSQKFRHTKNIEAKKTTLSIAELALEEMKEKKGRIIG